MFNKLYKKDKKKRLDRRGGVLCTVIYGLFISHLYALADTLGE